MDIDASVSAHGVIIAPLTASHPDHIVVGSWVLLLRPGTTCDYTPGTYLEVAYTEQDRRLHVDTIIRIGPL